MFCDKDFIFQYTEENDETQKTVIANEAIECLKQEDEKRTQELYNFIDDFVNSEEYLEYLKTKTSLKHNISTQYELNDIIIECEEKDYVEKYPLTEEQKKMFTFKLQFEKYVERKNKLKEFKKQENAIEVIRKKINQANEIFQCTKDIQLKRREEMDQMILKIYSTKFKTNFTKLSPPIQAKVLDRLKHNHRVVCSKKVRRLKNVVNIFEKLISEWKARKRAKEPKIKTFHMVKTEEQAVDLEIIGTKIILLDREKKTEEIKKESLSIEQSELKIDENKPEKRKKGKTKEDGKEKKNESKKNKISNVKKPKKEIKKKEKKKEKNFESKLILPIIPIINTRKKIIPENIDKIMDIIDEFRQFEGIMENKDLSGKKVLENYSEDRGIRAKPECIMFQNFDEGNTYYKHVSIFNVSPEVKKLRFLKFSFSNAYDELAFEIQNFGIRKLFTGCSLKFSIIFTPFNNFKCYEGKMLLLSYDVRRAQYYQFEVLIKCLPKCSDLKFYPNVVNFGTLPLWRAKNVNHFKVIKVKNESTKPCRCFIRKIIDPLDIQTIFNEDNKENINPVPNNSETSFQETTECVKNILNMCLENLENSFYFEESFLNLCGYEEKLIKIFLKNVHHIGDYFEKFTVDVYETFENGTVNVVGCQEISLFAETTGHFISVYPEVLDFGTCLLNSCYQINFEVINSSNSTQAVSIKFPAHIADIIHADISTFYLHPQSKRTVWLKLIPRSYIIRESSIYFDKTTSVLEFKVHLHVVSKNYNDYPVIKVPVFGVLANSYDLTISTISTDHLTNFLNTTLLDIGECSIRETISVDIYLVNNTVITQICAFTNLPKCVTLVPNYGFIKLLPNQRKQFKLYLSPEIIDFPSYAEGNLNENQFFFKLIVETVSHIGKLKEDLNMKKLRASVELMLKQMSTTISTKKDTELLHNIFGCVSALKKRSLQASMMNNMGIETKDHSMQELTSRHLDTNLGGLISGEDFTQSFDDTVLNYQNFVILETQSRKEIWCKTNLIRPLLELSYQSVEFPDTPSGSYSVMEVTLKALARDMERECDMFNKRLKKAKMDFKAGFKIVGNNKEISIEPKCGILQAGESIKLTLLAKPNIPQELVNETAKSIKYQEIYDMKLNEFKALSKSKGRGQNAKVKKEKSNKESDKTKAEAKNKGKENVKKKKDKEKPKTEIQALTENEPDIVITDKDLEYDYLDLYPAEMVYWRNMNPYYIKANFICYIDYESGGRKQEKIYLDAICKVVKPDFKSDLKIQRIDFGKCIIGMPTTKTVMLQNIKYESIAPKAGLISPVGPFSIPYIKNLRLPPEHILKLPIEYCPASADKVMEYLEIRSNATVLPLILSGEGILPIINILPNFTVFRLETKQNRLAELHFKIENASDSDAEIQFEKLFEIEGSIANLLVITNKTKKENEEKGKKPEKHMEKKIKATKDKTPKCSDSLTDIEREAINKLFQKSEGDSHFALSCQGKKVNIQPGVHTPVTVFFGDPHLLQKRLTEQGKKGKKGKDKTSADTASNKSGSSKKSRDSEKQYITQYNISVGKTFIKNVILVCTIK